MDLSERPERETARHPWERARFHHFHRVLQGHGLLREPTRVLDIGAGDGWFAGRLSERLVPGSAVTCWDRHYDAAALDALYARADIVVQVAAYEAFGMAIAEAVARGLPVITSPAGVNRHLPEGAVCEVDDNTLADTLAELLRDAGARRAQADRAWAAAALLPTWTTQAEKLAAVVLGESS